MEESVYIKALRFEVTVIHFSTFGMNEVESVRAGYKVIDTDIIALFLEILA